MFWLDDLSTGLHKIYQTDFHGVLIKDGCRHHLSSIGVDQNKGIDPELLSHFLNIVRFVVSLTFVNFSVDDKRILMKKICFDDG